MYAARGNHDSLKVILARGLDCGLTVSEEKEVLTQLYAYCGFPRSMGALVTLMNLTQERAAQGIKDEAGLVPSRVKSSDMFVVGGQNQLKLFGRPALGEVLTFAPALDQFLKAHLFGDLFSRDNLDWRTRELLAPLNHDETAIRVKAERAMNTRLEGGCQVPIGSYAELINCELWLRALVGASDCSQIVRG